jgi:hypothetical protein
MVYLLKNMGAGQVGQLGAANRSILEDTWALVANKGQVDCFSRLHTAGAKIDLVQRNGKRSWGRQAKGAAKKKRQRGTFSSALPRPASPRKATKTLHPVKSQTCMRKAAAAVQKPHHHPPASRDVVVVVSAEKAPFLE